jgi:hypothetical protein
MPDAVLAAADSIPAAGESPQRKRQSGFAVKLSTIMG